MRYYSSSAGAMTLAASATSTDATISLSATTGLPVSYPYTLVLDVGTAAEEIVTVTAVAGTTATVTRGEDGTSAQAHTLGAAVRHLMTARDLREPQQHIDASTAVHGLSGAVVGTTDTQTLTNKTINGGTVNPTTLQQGGIAAVTISGTQTLTNKTISGATNTFSAIPSSAVTGLDTHTGATAAHGATGAVVGTTNTQTLTNKTLDGATLTGTTTAATVNATAVNVGGVAVVTESDSGWIALTLGTGWSATTGHTPQYRKYRGVLYIRGAVTNSASTTATVGTLPAGYRPSVQQFLGSHVTSDGKAFELMVDTAGVIQTIPGYATGTAANTAAFPISSSFLL